MKRNGKGDAMEDLQACYKRYTDRRLDGKTLAYWQNALSSGQSTPADYELFVRDSRDYANALLRRFSSLYAELIGADAPKADVESFVQQQKASQRLWEEADVRGVIALLPTFEHRHRDLIQKVHRSLGADAEALTPERTSALVDRFRSDPTFDVDALEAELQARPTPPVPPTPAPTPASPAPTPGDEAPAWADDWEAVFERPVFLQEYLRFGERLATLGASDARDWMRAHKRASDDLRLSANDVLMRYAGRPPMSEYEFVKRYLAEALEPEFADRLLARLLGSPEYHEAMSAALERAYRATYDVALDSVAVGYLFAQALERRLSLSDPGLQELVVAFKSETDAYVERVYRAYLDIYQREPDEGEIAAHVATYRAADADKAAVDRAIARALIAALEFHDIVKKKLRFYYLEATNTEIAPSALYRLLDACLSSIEGSESMDHVVRVIKSSVDSESPRG
jgi:hypothetical protein